MRDKPEDADSYSWEKFELYADANGIGTDPEDWRVWWECWSAGFSASKVRG